MKEFLARFNPPLMSPETLEAIFVQREKLAQSLVERVRDSVLTPSKHYVLLIGPRGMGKTHLVALVYHRVKAMEDLQDPMCIAWLREEEWVTSYLDLLLRILRALHEEYGDADLAEQTEALYDLSAEEAERAAADTLLAYLDGRVLLVLIENLDEIFRGLKQEGQQQLRAFLQNHGNTMMLATAQSLFNGVSLRTSPFYGFFNVQHLKQLDINDATRLLIRIAELAPPDLSLVAFLQTPKGRARVRAVHHLAGGNPRVYLIFAQFLNREALDDLVKPFMQMLDDLTPYYQSRMLYLSPQQRKIVEFLVENRGAAPVKRIAQRCFLTHQTATSQLKTLRDNGYVKSEPIGRESFYELREPLMRLVIEVKKQRDKPIRLILDFLRFWYTQPELEERLASLPAGAVLEREYVLHALAIIDGEAEDPRVMACAKDLLSYREKGDFESALQAAEDLIEIRGNASDWESRGFVLGSLGRYEEALASFERAVELNPEAAQAWSGQGLALESLGRYEEALASLERAVGLDPEAALTWGVQGLVLLDLGRYEEALASFERAVELNPEAAQAWHNQGVALERLGRYEEALSSYERTLALNPEYASAWSNQGAALGNLGRYEEALAAFEQAIALEDQATGFLNRAIALSFLERWDETLDAVDDALQRVTEADLSKLIGATGTLLRRLLTTQAEQTWQDYVQKLVAVYDRHEAASQLASGLAGSLTALKSETLKTEAWKTWLKCWEEAAGGRDEYQLPLRLLDAAIRYRETEDQRVLLALPVEERRILEEVLGLEGASS